jgi:cobaltochelatase CobS
MELSPNTDHVQSKAVDAIRELGPAEYCVITSENRGAAKTFMNGIGFKSDIYLSMKLETLQKSYQSIKMNDGSYLRAIVRNHGGTPEQERELIDRAIFLFEIAAHKEVAEPTPEPEPEPTPEPEPHDDLANQIAGLLRGASNGVTESRVKELIEESRPRALITIRDTSGVDVDLDDEPRHEAFQDILTSIACNHDVALVGPAGSGKTYLCQQVAKALNRDFEISGAVSQEYKLVGHVKPDGDAVITNFRRAFLEGKIMILDEYDACNPNAVLTINAALSSRVMDFPDGTFKAHENFCAIACMNTFGRGADRKYVGRNRLDAATLDRFDFIEMNYDESLERDISPDPEWTRYVQKIRHKVEKLGEDYVISPRASIRGGELLKAGADRESVINKVLRKGIPAETWKKIEAA